MASGTRGSRRLAKRELRRRVARLYGCMVVLYVVAPNGRDEHQYQGWLFGLSTLMGSRRWSHVELVTIYDRMGRASSWPLHRVVDLAAA